MGRGCEGDVGCGEEVQTGEGDCVDLQLFDAGVELSGKAYAACGSCHCRCDKRVDSVVVGAGDSF